MGWKYNLNSSKVKTSPQILELAYTQRHTIRFSSSVNKRNEFKCKCFNSQTVLRFNRTKVFCLMHSKQGFTILVYTILSSMQCFLYNFFTTNKISHLIILDFNKPSTPVVRCSFILGILTIHTLKVTQYFRICPVIASYIKTNNLNYIPQNVMEKYRKQIGFKKIISKLINIYVKGNI